MSKAGAHCPVLPGQGKKLVREAALSCAGSLSLGNLAQLPRVRVCWDGVSLVALLDTGCTRSIVSSGIVGQQNVRPCFSRVVMMNGQETSCSAACTLSIEVAGV